MQIAVAVIAYNRPHYFRHVVNALSHTPQAAQWPHFFFLDGGPESSIAENTNIITSSLIKNIVIIERQRNFGCGKNLIDVRRYLFDREHFDAIFIVEDDVVLAPHYFSVTANLLTWARQTYDNIGIVQCWSHCTMDRQAKARSLGEVKLAGPDNLLGYVIHRDAWDAIKKFVYLYETLYLEHRPYALRPYGQISQFFHEAIKGGRRLRGINRFPGSEDEICHYPSPIPSSQDMATLISLWRAGYCRISTVVNHALYIGQSGIHSTPQMWREMFGKIQLDVFQGVEAAPAQFYVGEHLI